LKEQGSWSILLIPDTINLYKQGEGEMHKATVCGITVLAVLFFFAVTSNCYARGHGDHTRNHNRGVAEQGHKSFKKVNDDGSFKGDPGDPEDLQIAPKKDGAGKKIDFGPVNNRRHEIENTDDGAGEYKGDPGDPEDLQIAPKDDGSFKGDPGNPEDLEIAPKEEGAGKKIDFGPINN
jgi:hypothetical protein